MKPNNLSIDLSHDEVLRIMSGKQTQIRRPVRSRVFNRQRVACFKGISGPLPLTAESVLWGREVFAAHWGANPLRPGGMKNTWAKFVRQSNGAWLSSSADCPLWVHYAARDPSEVAPHVPWSPASHMPRWASRISFSIIEPEIQCWGQATHKDANAQGFYSDLPFETSTEEEHNARAVEIMMESHKIKGFVGSGPEHLVLHIKSVTIIESK